jgi:N-acetylglutamate synthase-like GNAT family acetyltransferase
MYRSGFSRVLDVEITSRLQPLRVAFPGDTVQADSTLENTMKLREAAVSDAEAIARLVNAAFAAREFFIDGDRTNPADVRAMMEKGKFLLGEEAGKLVGCVYAEVRGDRGYFGLLSVDPARQGSGIGSELIAAAENYCQDRGCLFMDLRIVNLRTELPSFYHRRGYVESGTEPFPEEARTKIPCHLVRMSKPLI